MTERGAEGLKNRTPGAARARVWRGAGATLVTLAVAAIIEILSSTALRVPNPPAFLLLAVAASAFRAGPRAGLISALIAWLYIAYFFSLPDRPFAYSDENFRRVLVWAFTIPALALMVGVQRRRLEGAGDLRSRELALEAQRATERRFQALIEHSSDAISLIGPDGIIRYDSPSAGRILGYAPGERIGQNGFESVHPDDLDRTGTLFAEMLQTSGGSVTAEFRVRRKDGAWRWLEGVGTNLLHDPSVGAIVVNFRDITRRREIEDEIRRLNLQLEQRVAERTAELREAKDEAERANRAKSEFLSRMSHELRTPLNAILGFAQLLEMDSLQLEQKESVELILKGGRHLLALINEVLDIARIEAGQMSLSPEPVHLQEVVRESLDLIAPLAAPRNLTVTGGAAVTWDRYVLADRQRLQQVLLNLLSNAVKYNRPDGTVALCCEETPRGRVRIAVRDSGPGLSAEQLARLFVPFERLGADTTVAEGTGMGLALTKGLVEAMGGAIGVESAPGEGSVFWVDLAPTDHPAEREQPVRATAAAPEGHGHMVLYIDNNPANIRLMQRVLEQRADIRLLVAMHGSLGLDLACQHRPDLILLDLHLPDMSGDEVLSRLQGDPRTLGIPVAVITADTRGDGDRLLARGARHYFTKPLDVRQFLVMLDRTLREQRVEGRV